MIKIFDHTEFSHGTIYQGDCLKIMSEIDNDTFDMILCDLPYGITACHWDIPLNLEALWAQYKRKVKEMAVVVLTSKQPFTTDLINSNRKWFRQELIWNKKQTSLFLNAKHMPLPVHENILIFAQKSPVYNPIMTKTLLPNKKSSTSASPTTVNLKKRQTDEKHFASNLRYPTSIINIGMQDKECCSQKRSHSTQKPLALFEYLIRTYSNKGDNILDNCIGSGTTAIAAYNTGRTWLGIEKDPEIYETACKRIEEETKQQILL